MTSKALETYWLSSLLNPALLIGIAFVIGGSAMYGTHPDGRYFLNSHGKMTEVTGYVWYYSLIHSIVAGLHFVSALILSVSQEKK